MKAISLFAGIGGFDLALSRLNHDIVYVNEWDKYAADTYQKNFRVRPDTRSITIVPTSDIPDHNLLVGGFPCQAFSIAGKRRGFEETRGTLFFDIARILKDKRPRYFVLENVKGLLTHDSGKTFQTILRVLTDIGYELQWGVLNSKDFGVPQNRERVFIIGHLRGEIRPKVFPIRGSKSENQRSIEVVADLNDEKWSRFNESSRRVYGTDGIAPTIPTVAGGGHTPKIVALTEKRTEESKAIRREYMKQGRDWSPRRGKELVPRDDDQANTVTANHSKEHLLTDGLRIRRLTPLECERLQGFPDNWTAGVSDTQRYKQLGNAVTVNVVYEVLSRLN